jgi:hypothetical protein
MIYLALFISWVIIWNVWNVYERAKPEFSLNFSYSYVTEKVSSVQREERDFILSILVCRLETCLTQIYGWKHFPANVSKQFLCAVLCYVTPTPPSRPTEILVWLLYACVEQQRWTPAKFANPLIFTFFCLLNSLPLLFLINILPVC